MIDEMQHGCLGFQSGVARLGLRVIMRLNNRSLKIEKFKKR